MADERAEDRGETRAQRLARFQPSSGMATPRFSGLASFMRLPVLAPAEAALDCTARQVAGHQERPRGADHCRDEDVDGPPEEAEDGAARQREDGAGHERDHCHRIDEHEPEGAPGAEPVDPVGQRRNIVACLSGENDEPDDDHDSDRDPGGAHSPALLLAGLHDCPSVRKGMEGGYGSLEPAGAEMPLR